jgi:hypothetical protein
MRTWDEHLAWCKQRALEYVDRGELADAIASMGSNLNKHPETKLSESVSASLMAVAKLYIVNHDEEGVRRWVESFR